MSISSGSPTPVLPDTQTIGTSEPWATALTISRAISSSLGGVPSKYRSITASSTSMIDSSSGSLSSAGSTSAPAVSAGGLSVLATPRNSAPWPSGTLNSTHALPNSSWMFSTSVGKSMLSESILLRTMIRPSPAFLASAKTRRVFTSMPDWALMTMAAVSTPRMAPIAWPTKSG